MLQGETIICVSSIDWEFNWQGHQEIMSTFARHGNVVLFIENTGIRRPSWRDLPRLARRIGNWRRHVGGIRQVEERLYVCSPLILPFPYSRLAGLINRMLLYRTIKESDLFGQHEFVFPHDGSLEASNSKEVIQEAELFIAEVSYPSIGLGIELGWAEMQNTPIVCIHKESEKRM